MSNALKKLVIVYSLEGNAAFIADTIAETLGADLLELRPQKPVPSKGFLKFFIGGMQVLFKKTPELFPLDKHPDDYDLIVIGTPVWAGNYAPPLRTLFSTHPFQGKQVALFCCYGGNEGKSFRSMKDALQGNHIVGERGFREPLKTRDISQRQAQEWAKTLLRNEN